MPLNFGKGQFGVWFEIFVAGSNQGPVTRGQNILTTFRLNIIHHIYKCELHMHENSTVSCTEPKV